MFRATSLLTRSAAIRSAARRTGASMASYSTRSSSSASSSPRLAFGVAAAAAVASVSFATYSLSSGKVQLDEQKSKADSAKPVAESVITVVETIGDSKDTIVEAIETAIVDSATVESALAATAQEIEGAVESLSTEIAHEIEELSEEYKKEAAELASATTPEGEEQPVPAENKGAFDPDTGEINWDCPCLGGMADGPCGEEFKAAFSCFVYSTSEPKGIDCIEKFGAMQNCFREHPEVYAEELREAEPFPEEDGATAAPVATEEVVFVEETIETASVATESAVAAK